VRWVRVSHFQGQGLNPNHAAEEARNVFSGLFSLNLALLTQLLPEVVFHTGNNEEPKKGRVWRPGPCVLNSVAKPVRYSLMMR
jgi:hypothetical protein